MTDLNSTGDDTPPVNKKLLWIVYSMGLIMLLLFFVLIGGMIYKLNKRGGSGASGQEVSLSLAQGDSVKTTQLQGDRLLIETTRELILLDVASGKTILTIKLTYR